MTIEPMPATPKPLKPPKVRGLQTVPNKIHQLMKRDGIICWLCQEPLGVDITIEHLLATTVGGANHMHNYVLTHKACNLKLGAKSIAEKVRMRERGV